MNMSWIDWTIVVVVMAVITYAAITTQKLTKTVADFLAANRCAGRYLLAIALGEAREGAASLVLFFQMFYIAGFTPFYWTAAAIPIGLLIQLSGWVMYRYRQTRALTLGQFFEQRYSRKFRIFTGILAWVSGVINFGVFPGIGARFFISFCGFPAEFDAFGITLQSYPVLMFLLVGIALYFTFMGGQIAVMVTDFWQGLFSTIVFAAIIGVLWFAFPWETICEGMIIASSPGKSLINPIDIGGQKDFNLFFFMIGWFFSVYGVMGWQGTQGYNCSAINAHEAKMSIVVSGLRGKVILLGMTFIPLVAIVIMHHPDFTETAEKTTQSLNAMYPGDGAEADEMRSQMLVTTAISHVIPIGLIGAFTVAMLGFFISTHNTYLHSWGSIFVQDVLCPLRKKTFANKQHLVALRLSIVGVAVFIFFFSWIYPMTEHIIMFFMITGAIYMGGVGSVVIGGLYWKRGTTAGAWASMSVGSFLAVSSIIVRSTWEQVPFLVQHSETFPINGQVMAFFCAVSSIASYVIVSLLTSGKPMDMDRILHRGRYAIQEEEPEIKAKGEVKTAGGLWRMIGVNNREFDKIDKGLFLYTFLMGVWGFGSFAVLLYLHYTGLMNDHRWLIWWRIYILILLVTGLLGGIWISIGGIFDLRKMYRRLKALDRNLLDDGRVVEDHNLADDAVETTEENDISE